MQLDNNAKANPILTNMNKYKKYQHVEKLGNQEVDGILFGTCYIFPKIDGTNAHVWLEDGMIHAGSRTRELSEDKDNAGFFKWVIESEKILEVLNALPDGAHVFGEWLVPHSLKTYRQDAWRRFYIFDVVIGERHMPYEDYKKVLNDVGYDDYIAPIRIIKNPTEENVYATLEQNNYLIEDGKGAGEGVVIKNYSFENKYGRQVWAKVVTSEFKEKHHKEMGAPISNGSDFVEEKIANEFITAAMVDKVIAKIENECGGWSSKYIQRLLQTVFYDLVREHSWDYVKKHKNPKIDYKTLMRFSVIRIKELKQELF